MNAYDAPGERFHRQLQVCSPGVFSNWKQGSKGKGLGKGPGWQVLDPELATPESGMDLTLAEFTTNRYFLGGQAKKLRV